MPELRKDPVVERWVIIATERARRPMDFAPEVVQPRGPEGCPFCPGHEDRTPPEVYAVRPNGGGPDTPGWTVRVVPNLYPALTQDAHEPEREANPDLYTAQPAAGHHEVIVNAPDVVKFALLAFTAGVLLTVVIEEIMPEAHRTREPRLATAAFVGGFALFALLSSYLGG